MGLKLEYIFLRTRCAHHPRDFHRHRICKEYNLWRPPAQIFCTRALFPNSSCVCRFSVINGAALVSPTSAVPQHPSRQQRRTRQAKQHQQRQRASVSGGSASHRPMTVRARLSRYLPLVPVSIRKMPGSSRWRSPFPAPRSLPRRRSARPASARSTAQAPTALCCSAPSSSPVRPVTFSSYVPSFATFRIVAFF